MMKVNPKANFTSFSYHDQRYEVGSDEWKHQVLSADPFMGDIGGCGTILTDKIVKTRNTLALCSGCLSICEKGTYNRVMVEAEAGSLLKNRFCQLCCTTMGFEELCIGYEGWDETSLELFVQDEDEFVEDDMVDEEPLSLEDYIYTIRESHEQALAKVIGRRWFEAPDVQRHKVISELTD